LKSLLLLLALAAPLAAAPLGPADQASVETLLLALGSDPFAEQPLDELTRIYGRGPGPTALLQLCRDRSAAAPKEPRWLIVIGRLELARGRRAEGLQAIERAAQVEHAPANLVRLARLLDENGARPAAIAAYRASLSGASPGERRQVLLRLGALQAASGQAKEAKATWDEARRLAPKDAALRREIAEALVGVKAYRLALDELHDSEPLLAGDAAALVVVQRREADLARRAGDRARAGRDLGRAFLTAQSAGATALEAELARDLLRLYEVRPGHAHPPPELRDLVAKLEAEQPGAAALRAELLAASGDRAGAAGAFRLAIGARPTDAYLLRRLTALEEGPARIRDLRALFAAQPADGSVGLELVGALLDEKDPRGAVEIGRVLATRFAGNPLLLGELARALSRAGLQADALPLWERAATLAPDDPDISIAWGDALRSSGRDTEARAAYQRLARDGSVVSARQLIGVLDRRHLAGDTRRAYEDALARHGDDEQLRRDYARWLAANGLAKESIAEWRRLAGSSRDPLLHDFAAREVERLERQLLLDRQ
jgi:Flp pilus assembly protein TadD